MEINSIEMTLTLPQEEKEKIVLQCQDLLGESSAFMRKLNRLILPAPQQYRAMQRQQISELQETGITTQKETMSAEVKAEELDWWVQNLHLAKGRLTISASL